ncbi:MULTISPECIES: hypothetical protein [Actinomadura]|uniref:Uncharacterized protein n=1 Tax=Actinomadura yumaensis TaxID=111807 RepID=A0ABW2CDY7_9ACTN|nr:hypothetical protein [Actinomadura sp. J1-007]
MASDDADETAVAGAGPTTQQDNWRHCRKCFGLWWNGAPTNGACPAGGSHDGTGSWNFYLPANPAEHL